VDVEPVAAPDQERVVPGDGHVVQEDLRIRGAADPDLITGEAEGLTRAAPAGADDERPLLGRNLRIDRLDVPRVVELPCGRRVIRLLLDVAEERAALLAVVRPFAVDEPAFRAVHGAGLRALLLF